MSKKILVLKNQGTLELESQDWMELMIYNYQRITIDKKNTYLLKEPGKDSFHSLNEKIGEIDGAMIYVSNSAPEIIREIVDILDIKNIPHVLLMEEESTEISKHENEIFAIDNNIESLILALNKLSMLIDKNQTINSSINDINLKKEILQEYALKKETIPLGEPKTKEIPIKNSSEEILSQKEEGTVNICHSNDSSVDKLSTAPYDEIIEEKLKKIKFNLHPIMMNEVKCSLERLGFSNITVTDIKYLDPQNRRESYRGSNYNMSFSPRLEVMMVVRESEMDYIFNILSELKNEDISDYAIIYSPEDAIRISTNEQGSSAID